MSEPLFRVDNLRLSLPDMTRKPLFGAAPRIEILRGLSFDISAGSTIGIVGESGSGKSTLGRAMVRLHEPTEGAIRFDGQDITHLSNTALLPLRRDLQVIFQDPYSSLNPRKSIGAIIGAPLLFHNVASDSADAGARAAAALHAVGLPSAFAVRYPHELSGGQRQRVEADARFHQPRSFRRPAPVRPGDRDEGRRDRRKPRGDRFVRDAGTSLHPPIARCDSAAGNRFRLARGIGGRLNIPIRPCGLSRQARLSREKNSVAILHLLQP
jgi:ABC-type lipoprotein export system ATPase subunit